MAYDILNKFIGKTVSGIEFNQRYKIAILFEDNSCLTIDADGPEGSRIEVEAEVLIKERL